LEMAKTDATHVVHIYLFRDFMNYNYTW